MDTKRQLKALTRYTIGFVVVFFFAYFFSISSVGTGFTNLFTDPIQSDTPRKEVVIVGVDDVSLQTIGAWPWDRKIFADLVSVLDAAHPRVIGFDVLFLEPRAGDDAFIAQLQKTKTPVVLASKLEGAAYYTSFLGAQVAKVTAGVANVDPDQDGKVRAIPLQRSNNDVCLSSLAQALYTAYIGLPKNTNVCDVVPRHFRYQGSPLTHYSLVDVLQNKIPADAFKDKIVLIGSVTLDLEDHFVGITGAKVPGVDVHGQIVTTILNNSFDTPLSRAATFFTLLLLAVLAGLIGTFARTMRVQGILLAALLVTVELSAFFAFDNHIIAPFFAILFVPLFSYGYTVLYRYIHERKQGAYVRQLFGKYVHPSLLEELMLDPRKVKLGGERRHMSILFSDVRGFTTISEGLSPEGLVDLLNNYLNAMSPIILERRGTIDKYIGDAIMAFWNAPVVTKDHEIKAVESALAMEKKLKEFNVEHNTNLGIGIGINSGDVVVGNMGSEERLNYTVMGDAVNLASRLEGMTKKYGVITLVSQGIKEKGIVEGLFYRKLDDAKVKGKNEAVEFYEPMYDTKENRDKAALYDRAYAVYQEGKFTEARNILASAVATDGAAKALFERCEYLALNPPTDWHGVWKWDEK